MSTGFLCSVWSEMEKRVGKFNDVVILNSLSFYTLFLSAVYLHVIYNKLANVRYMVG